jgi:hypothetical protein
LGILKTIAARNPETTFYYACLKDYFFSVSWMLQSLSNVFPLAVDSGRETRQYAEFKNATYLPIGIYNVDIRKFDESFYAQHQVPFSWRWELAKTPAGLNSQNLFHKLNPDNRPFMLICKKDSSSATYQLNVSNPDNLRVIEVHLASNNIFDWTDLVLGAQEIHTIDTAFIHFVENTLEVAVDKKLYFHRIRQSPTEFTRRLPWQEILY